MSTEVEMDRRLQRMPAAVAFTATCFVLFGALLLVKAASDVMIRGSGRDPLIVFGLTTLAGVAFTATGLGVAARRRWARILGFLGALLVMLGSAAMMLFVGLMAAGVGIGWGDRLFLEPFSLMLAFASVAVGSIVALVRSRTWFDTGPRTGEHATSVPALVAGGVMFLVGVLLAPWGPILVGEGLGHGADSGMVREVMVIVGGAILVVGLLHVLAALLVLAHRDQGRSLGIAISGVGAAMLTAGALVGGPGNLTLLLMPVPHLIVLIGLLVGHRHFPGRHTSGVDPVSEPETSSG